MSELTHAATGSLWQELRAAIRGSDADYTRIPLPRAIFLLAIPMILELVMESTFAVADIWFVGRLGAEAVATVGLTETFLFLLYALAMGLAMGITAIVARRIGEGERDAAALAGSQAILIGVLASLPFSIAGIWFARDLLALLGASGRVLEEGWRYTQWMLGGNLVIMLLFVVNAVFRGAGDAAIATNIGRGCGVLLQLWALWRGGKHLRVAATHLRLHGATLLHIVQTSLGGVGQMLIAMTSWILLMRILADVGSAAVAGATITIRVMMLTMMPAWGLSNAAATLVGQNLGAGQPERAESTVWKIGRYTMVFLVGVSFLYYFFNEEIVGIFSDDAAVVAVGAQWMQILAYSYFVYGWWMVSVQAFNGAGDTRTPTWINFIFFWLIQIPLCWWLAIALDWRQGGVFWGVFVSETGVGLFTLWLFSKGRWKLAKV